MGGMAGDFSDMSSDGLNTSPSCICRNFLTDGPGSYVRNWTDCGPRLSTWRSADHFHLRPADIRDAYAYLDSGCRPHLWYWTQLVLGIVLYLMRSGVSSGHHAAWVGCADIWSQSCGLRTGI